MRMYPDEYTTNIDWTCSDCDTTYEDVEVDVANDIAVVSCEKCDSHGIEIELGDWDGE